ncbi:hypothetical protein [Rhodocista pekingensis]|uniref:Flagellar basal body-associated FliL family protein n=1 Tax=Rhodocista pekingensis TaxID=201185 RepID=A0ABW2KSJ0_9PROT
MKKIVLFALALLMLIGGGVGGYIMFGQHKDGAHAAEEKPKPVGPPAFVTIGPLILPVIGDKRVEQTVMLTVAIEVPDEATKEQVKLISPRLNAAFLTALYGNIGKAQVLDGQIIDVAGVRSKLMEAAVKELGADVVKDVLIQTVSQRPAY